MRKLNLKTIIKLTCLFCKKILPYLPKSSTKRGRLCTFPDHQIISMLVIKECFLSPSETLSLFLNHISNAFLLFTISIIDQENQKDIDSIIVDGTGIGKRKIT